MHVRDGEDRAGRQRQGGGWDGSKWFHVTDGTVYFDHPVHAMAEHTLNIDFSNPSMGPGARVAVELTAASALELVAAIEAALASAPEALKV